MSKDLFRKESLERLSSPERLDELMTIVNLKTWLPLGAIGVLLGLGLIWSWIGRIPVTTSGRGLLVENDLSEGELVALLHFDNIYRGQFRPGMSVVLTPETLLVYNEPGLKAEIIEVLEPEAMTLSAVRGVDSMAETESENDRLEVLAQLLPMDAAMPPNTVVPGVAVQGRITLEERAPITFVFPFLAR
ncbi:hypothetical protein [Almyronema epifaneia]|uniref:NHLP bacteriocin system secretion protein n=1 Tax=Almyronema epifaneia S1 TaxID=2991925 RepID=A0ABW6IJA2_9CYAN